MNNRKPFRWLLAVLAVLALVATACGGNDKKSSSGAGSEGKPQKGGALVDYQNFSTGEPDHIDPALAGVIEGSQVTNLVYDGLTDIDYKTGDLKPAVAQSWTSSADLKEWTFKLRKTKWSDGTQVLPSDFKYAWERVLLKSLASEIAYHITDNVKIVGSADVAAGKATEMSGLVADDNAMTLKITLEAPLSFLPNILAHSVFSPVPKKIVSALPDQTKWEQGVMIGNGPFKMTEPWKHDQYIKLARSDNYWGGVEDHKAYLDTIDFVISKDLDSAFAAFEAGTGQTGRVPSGRFAEVIAKYAGHNTTSVDLLGTYYWGFNQKDKAVGGDANLKLRQAISLVIDRDAINKTVYNNTRKVATGFTPPGMPGYKANLSDIAKRDLPRAQQLLAEWKTANRGKAPPTIKLNFNAGAGHEGVATIVQANLKELGINASLAPGDSKTYFSNMRKGQGQLLRAGWIYDYVAYDNGLTPLFSTAAIGGDNLELYSNPAFDQLITQARATKDETQRNSLYQQAEKIVLDNVVVIPLTWYRGQVVYANSVHNVIESATNFVAYDDIWLSKTA
ncbi:MAG TPA: peptide ABC transporter substrate-binding protein [Acidimicrobiales bacterium]|nr:peptide ABC transporter substrate-binding protein [Acidimicrobiales bacterium]